MDDRQVALLVIAIFVLVVPLSFGLALWLIARLRRRSDRPLSSDATGIIAVPVRRLGRSFGLFGYSHNSIGPRLEIAPDGLRFKVFRPDHWPFADIAEVDAPRLLFVTRLAVRSRGRGRLYIDLADRARARDLLLALPPGVPLTPRATDMRDGRA